MDNITEQESKILSEEKRDLFVWKKRFYKYGAIVLGLTIFTAIVLACNFFIQAVLTVIFTAILTFILSKPVNYFQSKGLSRATGTTLSLIITFVIIVLCVAAFIPPIVEQIMKLVQAMPGYINDLETQVLPKFPELQNMLSQQNIDSAVAAAQTFLEQNGGALAGGAMNALAAVAGGVGFAFGIVFVTIILTMSILIDLPQLAADFMSIFEEKTKKAIRVTSRAIGVSFYGWLTMMVICGFVFGLVTAIVLSLIGVPYAFVVGLLCFLSFFIPAVGPIVAAIGAGLAGLCNVWWLGIIAAVLTFVIACIIQGTLQPNLTQSKVNINPGFALFAGMVGNIIWGPIGLLIGVPIYAAIQALFVEYCRVYRGKDLASSESKLFISTKPEDNQGLFTRLKNYKKKDTKKKKK